MIGIFAIHNIVTDRRYIFASTNEIRYWFGGWSEHGEKVDGLLSDLKQGKASVPELQEDFDTYGESVFEIEVLEAIDSLEDHYKSRWTRRQLYIDRYAIEHQISPKAGRPYNDLKIRRVNKERL